MFKSAQKVQSNPRSPEMDAGHHRGREFEECRQAKARGCINLMFK